MGSQDTVPVEAWTLRQSGSVTAGIFVSPEYLNGFGLTEAGSGSVPVVAHGVYPSEPLSRDRVTGLDLAVVEVLPGERRSIERLTQLIASQPDTAVIAAIASPDVALVRTLVREGVADVVSLPLEETELRQVILEVLARRADHEVKLCPMVAVVKANGGCGASTTATQLVGKLADDEWTGAPPALIDLDVQFGTAAEYLSIEQSGSILDLLQSAERLDDALVDSIASTKDGFSVIGAPKDIVPLETVEVDSVLNTVQFMRTHFGTVVLDLPASWTNWSLSLLSECNQVLLVAELSLHSLRQAKRNLELIAAVGVPRERVRIVLNRVEKKLFRSLRPEDAGRTLDCEVAAVLPLEEAVNRAQQSGELIFEHARKCQYAQEFAKLAASIRTIMDSESNR